MARVYAFSENGWLEFQSDFARMRSQLLNRNRNPALGTVGGEQGGAAPYFLIPFRNDSGETIPAFAVMRVTGATGLGSIPVLTVAKPNTAFQRRYLVNGPLAVSGASGQNTFGLGTWAEQSAFVLYDDANTPAYGEEWGPSNGSWEIKKYRYGFHILGGATGGDTDLVGCYQMVVNEFYGQTDGALNKGSTQTVSVFDGNNADTTDNVASVNNRYGNIATTKKVTVRYIGGIPQAVSAECP